MKQLRSIKCVLVGDSKSGKTALLYTLSKGIFPTQHLPTVINNVNVGWKFEDNQATISFWDTPGDEKEEDARSVAYQNADVILITFSLNKLKDVSHIREKWFNEVQKYCSNASILLIGTNLDKREDLSYDHNVVNKSTIDYQRRKDEDMVNYSKGLTIAKEIGATSYIESSAKNDVGFKEIKDEILRSYLSRNTRKTTIFGLSIDINNMYEKLGFRRTDDKWNLDLTQLSSSIRKFSGNLDDLDNLLCNKIQNEQLTLVNIDKECFELCCELGLNKVVEEVLKNLQESSDEIDYGVQVSKERGKVSSFVRKISSRKKDVVDFEISLESMQSNLTEKNMNQILKLHPGKVVPLMKSTIPSTGDNLLHVLLNRNFVKPLMYLMEDRNLNDLYFQPNKCGNIPLATAVENCIDFSQSESTGSIIDISKLIWKEMIKTGKQKQLTMRLTKLNNGRKNILHICAESRMNDLLLDICKEPWVAKEELEKALHQEDGDKMSPIFRCFDENTILELINFITKFDIRQIDILGNNAIHIFGEKNFVSVIKRIFKVASADGAIHKLLLHRNKIGNTPLMTCVLANSNDSLNLLLCTLFTMDTSGEQKEVINSILHEPNKKGNTLLSLILHYQQGRSLSKNLALQMEKDYHLVANNRNKTIAKLTTCLKNNVDPSTEVMNALHDVENCYDKSITQIILLFITLLIIELLIPFLVMVFDMSTDGYLVVEYYKEIDHNISIEKNSTVLCSRLNESIINGIEEETEKLFEIPGKLTGLPRFIYSLLFLIIPWIFYLIEYIHSRYYTNFVRKIQNAKANLGEQRRFECVVVAVKITYYLTAAVGTVIFWPFFMLFKRFKTNWESEIASSQKKFRMQTKVNEDIAVSSRAIIIEVAIESSFQPLLQLYLLLPGIIKQFMCYHQAIHTKNMIDSLSISEIFNFTFTGQTSEIQFLSILTSVISLSWSFTYYQSMKKKGALDFGSNIIGRILMLTANLLQISSRLLIIVIYAYLFGPGQFWPMMTSVLGHILIMTLLNYMLSYDWLMQNFPNRQYRKIFYHCLLNGICNLYIHNWIVKIDKVSDFDENTGDINEDWANNNSIRQSKTISRKGFQKRTSSTLFRQFIFDIIFVLETCVIVIVAPFELGTDEWILAFIALSQIFGIALKLIYYYQFHIWKNSFTMKQISLNIDHSMQNVLKSIGLRSSERNASTNMLLIENEENNLQYSYH